MSEISIWLRPTQWIFSVQCKDCHFCVIREEKQREENTLFLSCSAYSCPLSVECRIPSYDTVHSWLAMIYPCLAFARLHNILICAYRKLWSRRTPGAARLCKAASFEALILVGCKSSESGVDGKVVILTYLTRNDLKGFYSRKQGLCIRLLPRQVKQMSVFVANTTSVTCIALRTFYRTKCSVEDNALSKEFRGVFPCVSAYVTLVISLSIWL